MKPQKFEWGKYSVHFTTKPESQQPTPWWERVPPETPKPLLHTWWGVWQTPKLKLTLKPAQGKPQGRRVAGFYDDGKLDGTISADGSTLSGQYLSDAGSSGLFTMQMTAMSSPPSFSGTFGNGHKTAELRQDELNRPI